MVFCHFVHQTLLLFAFKEKFKKAIKTSQHAVREIVEHDKDQIQTIQENMEAIRKALDERSDEMHNVVVLCAKLKIPDVFKTLSSGTTALR